MQPVAGHPFLQLGGKSGNAAVPVGDVADQPAGQHQYIARLLKRSGQELDLHLLGMFILDFLQVAAHTADSPHLAVRILHQPGHLVEQ